MPTFAYEAVMEPGSTVKGEIDAEDPRAAAAVLLSRGYHVLSVQGIDNTLSCQYRLGFGFGVSVSHKDLVRYSRDLANLIQAGFPLSQALNMLRTQTVDRTWRAIWGGVHGQLEKGQTLSQALQVYSGVFNAVYVNLIRAGEESGKLPEMLFRLVDLGEKREEIRGRIKMALVYPSVMLLVGMMTVFVMMAFVVPMFIEVFKETSQVLPVPTRMLVTISQWMQETWFIILPFIAVCLAITMKFIRSASGQKWSSIVGLHIPLVNRLIKQSEVTALSRTLSTLLTSGVPIVTALHITAATLKNIRYQESVMGLSLAVREGELLSRIMTLNPLFPKMMTNIVSVGERTGDLSAALEQVAAENEQDLDREVKVIMTLLEPLMIVLMGAVVGFIVLAMLLPIFNLGDALQLQS